MTGQGESSSSFSDLYASWAVERQRQDPELEAMLASSYRETWQSGDGHDRFAVLDFIFDRRDQEGVDLIVEALRDTDARLARHAAVLIYVLLPRRLDFRPNIREDLVAFGKRFPESEVLSWAALQELDERD